MVQRSGHLVNEEHTPLTTSLGTLGAIPSATLVAMTDQWTLNRSNFEGRWQGRGVWFTRTADGVLDLEQPMRVMDPTTYAISFGDPDTGTWDGSGLFFAPGGQATYPISRETYNAGGGCWQFPGAGGQSSLHLDPEQGRFGHEINLFRGRSRSMLVLMWELVDAQWLLQTVGAVAFRCLNATKLESQRPTCGTPETLLQPLRGWPGQCEILHPQSGVNGWITAPVPVVFDPEQLLGPSCSAVMPDGLVFSVPEQLPSRAFRLEVGGLLGTDLFQQISIVLDASGRLNRWERRRFQPVLL